MQIIDEPLNGLFVIEPNVFKDSRGYFFESYRVDFFGQLDQETHFIQDNQSLSQAGILRGLHFQAPPFAQAKLVRVIKGSVLDVVVDIRKESPTFGKHFKIELSESNFLSLYIPVGFAHGFYTLQNDTIFNYKCSNYYNKESEGGIAWNCPHLKIDWQATDPVLSQKDIILPNFDIFDSPF